MALADTANLVVSLRLDDQFSGPLARAQSRLSGLQGNFSRIGRGVGQVASGLDRLGTRAALAAAGGLTAVVTTAASFEQAFTGIEKTVDGSTSQLAKLEEQVRQMARTIPVSFEELSAIGEAGGALGIARQDLDEFIDVVARLGVSTNLSSDQAATALGQLGNVLHLRGEDFRDLADSLVALGNAGASTEDQIVEMAARFGAAGNAAGLSKEEILALSSAVASMGIEVEAGGGALSRVFNNIATNIGTSDKKASAFAKSLGLSAGEFKRAWERDALGTLQDFLRHLNTLDQFEAAALLDKVGITNSRDVATVRLMGQNVEFVGEQLKIANTAQGALNKESQKFFDTTQGQWKILVNNVRDAGATIGTELLPVVKDVVKEFTEFLDDPANRAKLKSFGQDLAKGARELIAAVKRGEFNTLIDTMKGAAAIAKTAFDAFNALPGPVKQLALAAIVANKVSGGAVGSIAKGLTNILIGAGGIFARGSSPANPLWVTSVGGGVGGAGGVAGAGRGFWAGVGKVIGLAGAVTIGAEVGRLLGGAIFDPTVAPAVEFEQSQFDKFIASGNTNAEVIQHNLDAVERGIYQIAGNTVDGLERWLIPQLGVLESQRDTLKQMLAEAQTSTPLGQFNARNLGGTPSSVKVENFEELEGGFEGSMRRAIDTSKLTLEQRLTDDPTFKRSIDNTAEFIRLLKRTSEFGAKGQGTSIEQGPTTGRDPLGDAFVALVRRLDKGLIKDPQVFGEINRHIQALEQVQGRLLRQGNVAEARHAQRNINALHRLLGTTDTTNAILRHLNRTTHSGLSFANRNLNEGNRRQREIAERVASQRETLRNGFQRNNEQLGIIARKPTQFTANVTNNITATLSTYQSLQTMTRINKIRTGYSPGDSTGGSL